MKLRLAQSHYIMKLSFALSPVPLPSSARISGLNPLTQYPGFKPTLIGFPDLDIPIL